MNADAFPAEDLDAAAEVGLSVCQRLADRNRQRQRR